MAISVVQTFADNNMANGTWTGNFGSAVGAGNTIFLAALMYSTSNVTISTSAPLFNGGSVSGAASLAAIQAPYGTNTSYVAIWMLPAVAGGATGVGLTLANGTPNVQAGIIGWEVAGLGGSPVLDVSSTDSGAGTGATSGTTGATTQAAEFVLGALFGIDGLTGTPTSPAGYTNLNTNGASNTASVAGYQIQASAGNTYTYANANANGGAWAGAVVTVASALLPPVVVNVSNPESAAIGGWQMLPVRGRVSSVV